MNPTSNPTEARHKFLRMPNLPFFDDEPQTSGASGGAKPASAPQKAGEAQPAKAAQPPSAAQPAKSSRGRDELEVSPQPMTDVPLSPRPSLAQPMAAIKRRAEAVETALANARHGLFGFGKKATPPPPRPAEAIDHPRLPHEELVQGVGAAVHKLPYILTGSVVAAVMTPVSILANPKKAVRDMVVKRVVGTATSLALSGLAVGTLLVTAPVWGVAYGLLHVTGHVEGPDLPDLYAVNRTYVAAMWESLRLDHEQEVLQNKKKKGWRG